MAAAYAALVSVSQTIQHLQKNPLPRISLDKPQTESLTENVAFLIDFLERYSFADTQEGVSMEGRIADAAHEAEDLIESHFVDQIEVPHGEENPNPNGDFLGQSLQKVTDKMELLKNEVTQIVNKGKLFLMRNYSIPASAASATGSLRSSSSSSLGHVTMVGRDDVMIDVMDKLTNGESGRHVIPIVGMGGIGKTTLAKNVFLNPLIVQYFDLCGWATISHDYDCKGILLEVLLSLKTIEKKEDSSQITEHELGQKLYQTLSGRRYLVVLDDMWSIEAWDKVKFYFPDYNNGSRIIVTTRLLNLASQLSGSRGLEMSFLDESNSWNLFTKCVFREEETHHLEFEEIGKRIAKSCRGLPLSITVIGALLSKHKHSIEYWEHVLANLNRVLNSEENEHCLKILRLSYVELPIHLKPCFLYLGFFREDSEISKSRLVKLWASEGFLKPVNGKCLEVVAEDYLQELVDRNLVLVHKRWSIGSIKICKLHDLLRDLCLKEAEKSKFLCIVHPRDPNVRKEIETQRRICFDDSTINEEFDFGQLQSFSLRSLIWPLGTGTINLRRVNCKLLRVLTVVAYNTCDPPDYLSANTRFLEFFCTNIHRVASSFLGFLCQQLMSLNRDPNPTRLVDIWKMTQLRHVNLNRFRVIPSSSVVLEHLQSLKGVVNFKFCGGFVEQIPNIKKLAIEYDEQSSLDEDYGLEYLDRLTKLESLCCNIDKTVRGKDLGRSLRFPVLLKKLTLGGTNLGWEEMGRKIGKLPNLQVLKLCDDAFIGHVWETVDGDFLQLKYLKIAYCSGLKRWEADSSHFPSLEKLVLVGLFGLEKIPREIGDIPTLESIRVTDCPSVIHSAKVILNEQHELGNEGFQLSFGE